MALFDNIGKKASEAGQNVLQKAKEMSDISRLNAMISGEEKTINNTYYQIGKLYVTIHKDNPEPDFSGMISSIAEAETRVKDYKRQIQDIKGVQRCEKCGAEVSKGAAFCSSCGATMPKVESAIPDGYVTCENCGAAVKKDMRFCTSCGKPMEIAAPIDVVPAIEAEVIERECPNCGAKLKGDVAFCTECGTRL